MAQEYVQIEILNITDLDKLLGTDYKMEQMFRDCVKKVLAEERSKAVQKLKGNVGVGYRHSKGDPRDAYKAVKYAVYKREIGGNISILNKRKASNTRLVGKGLNTYYGSDRGFILRWLNKGTPKRSGNRGVIEAHHIFTNISDEIIREAAQKIGEMIQEKIEVRFKEI